MKPGSLTPFTPFELAVLEALVQQHCPGKARHLPFCVPVGRDISGVGFYTEILDMTPLEARSPDDGPPTPVVDFELPNDRSGGAILYVEDQRITQIEVFANGYDDIQPDEREWRFRWLDAE